MEDLNAQGGVLIGLIDEKGVFGGLRRQGDEWVCVLWENGIARGFGGDTFIEAVQKAADAAGVSL